MSSRFLRSLSFVGRAFLRGKLLAHFFELVVVLIVVAHSVLGILDHVVMPLLWFASPNLVLINSISRMEMARASSSSPRSSASRCWRLRQHQLYINPQAF
jgi:hypothetical protein